MLYFLCYGVDIELLLPRIFCFLSSPLLSSSSLANATEHAEFWINRSLDIQVDKAFRMIHSIQQHSFFFLRTLSEGELTFLVRLSLKTQVVTVTFLGVRLFCGYIMVAPILLFLDFVTLLATFWVTHMIKSKLKSIYMAHLDTMPLWYLVNIYPLESLASTSSVPNYLSTFELTHPLS
ncbi:hypothetical protein H5410_047029 [Solanum commersonii]|uniref:Uncharacterized protein n=1 Tax=Solanum commersonii TaxID=4109 RepID=A0A9J5XDZ0_SOLCO|nr:hypothetical protein H5410_047029 [Solanum commersonii]